MNILHDDRPTFKVQFVAKDAEGNLFDAVKFIKASNRIDAETMVEMLPDFVFLV